MRAFEVPLRAFDFRLLMRNPALTYVPRVPAVDTYQRTMGTEDAYGGDCLQLQTDRQSSTSTTPTTPAVNANQPSGGPGMGSVYVLNKAKKACGAIYIYIYIL